MSMSQFAEIDAKRASDKWLWALCAIGLLLRLVPIWIDGTHFHCTPGDECSYLNMGRRFGAGRGMTEAKGWLWAPGYPALVGLHRFVTGRGDAIRLTQAILAVAVAVLLYRMVRSTLSARADAKTGARVAVAFYLLSPTQIFFAGRIWSEVIYGALLVLLVRIVVWILSERGSSTASSRFFSLGLATGGAMLLRGASTYLGVVLCGLVFAERGRRSLGNAAALALGVALVVAPYSAYASRKFGGFVLNERSLGAALWLGNNHFQPVTFDWGMGAVTRRQYRAHTANGYPTCGPELRGRACDEKQVRDGLRWIGSHPFEFVARIPRRLSHVLNPHSFLTRHLRNEGWPWLSGTARELLIGANMLWSIALMILGAAGFVLGMRYAAIQASALIVLYHLGVTAALVGMTRFRVPLEPLLALGAGTFAVHWRELFDLAARRTRWVCALLLVAIVPLILWHAGSGFRVASPDKTGSSVAADE